MGHQYVHVSLPNNWQETQDAEGGRVYRPVGMRSGFLRLSLYPPVEQPNPLIALAEMLESTDLPMGEQVHASITEGKAGPIATIVRKIPKVGLMQFWLVVPPEISIFASYQMGSAATAKQEFADAAEIIADLEMRESEDNDAE